jgi:hypothetical protein
MEIASVCRPVDTWNEQGDLQAFEGSLSRTASAPGGLVTTWSGCSAVDATAGARAGVCGLSVLAAAAGGFEPPTGA